MSTQTLEIPGTMKTIRAVVDLEYRGKTIIGRRRVRIDHKLGAYEEIATPDETVKVEQAFAKEAVMSGKAELLDGIIRDNLEGAVDRGGKVGRVASRIPVCRIIRSIGIQSEGVRSVQWLGVWCL